MDPVRVIEGALRGTGIELAGACGIAAYDARAPEGLRSADLMPRARGVVVAASAGRALWASFRAAQAAAPEAWDHPHPLDGHVASALHRADCALAIAGVGSRRFEPTLDAYPALDFRALGELAGLGTMGPFGLLIHPQHGPWWALRAAWLVDVATPDPAPFQAPCTGCAAPCIAGVSGHAREGGPAIALASPEVRARCVLGGASRYGDEQVAYHYDRATTLARLREEAVLDAGARARQEP